MVSLFQHSFSPPGPLVLPTSHGVPPPAARLARWGGCPVPDGGPGRLFFLRVMACRHRRRAPPGGVAARCRTVTRPARPLAGCLQPVGSRQVVSSCFPESWRAAGGGTPCPVGWLPGAGRWPVLHVRSPPRKPPQRAFRSFVRRVPQPGTSGRVLSRFSPRDKGFSSSYRPLSGRVPPARLAPGQRRDLLLILIRDISRRVRHPSSRAKRQENQALTRRVLR